VPRVVGVDIPAEKQVWCALSYVYGIGPSLARKILKSLEIDSAVRAKSLTEDQLSRIGTYIEKNYMVEGALRHHVAQKVQRLKDIRCFRGVRHRMGLPVRGQSTRTNARTRKGPRRTVAGKRSVKAAAH
jgi:small subunit ribosomal protein S13